LNLQNKKKLKPSKIFFLTLAATAVFKKEDADNLYNKGDIKKLYQSLLESKKIDEKNSDILWRLARAAHDLSQDPKISKEEKAKYINEAYALIEEAFKQNPNDFAIHKWFGIILSKKGELVGTAEKIKNSYIIRQHFDKACELNPKDATSVHLVGVWCLTFAEMGWTTKKLAAAFFAKPPESTYEEALSYFLKAENIEPGFYKKNRVLIAECYYHLGKFEQSKEWIAKAKPMAVKNFDDGQAHIQLEELYAKMKK